MTRVQIISLPASPDSTDAASFEWRLLPDLESEITTLAALCHVKQQQREPIPRSTNRGDDEIDDGDPAEDEEGTDMFWSLSLTTVLSREAFSTDSPSCFAIGKALR